MKPVRKSVWHFAALIVMGDPEPPKPPSPRSRLTGVGMVSMRRMLARRSIRLSGGIGWSAGVGLPIEFGLEFDCGSSCPAFGHFELGRINGRYAFHHGQ